MLGIVLVGGFMILLDTTIVNVAIPSIQQSLRASYGSVEWMVSGYAVAFGLVLVPAGRLGDRFGRRRMFLVSLAGFTVTSLLCGTSSSAGELVAWRVVQGAMAGSLNPQILAAIQVVFAPRERGRAFAFYGAMAGVATALGPLLGGILVTANLGGLDWRPIFLLNVPIGVVAMTGGWRLIPESRGRAGGLDPVGVAVLAAALLLILLPLVEGRTSGWPPWSFAALAASLLMLGGFVAWERLRLGTERSPLVDLRLFRYRVFGAGTGLSLVYFAGFTSVFFSLSLWLQIGLGRSALSAGLTILPYAVGDLTGASLSNAAARRLGVRVLHVGTAMTAVGLGAALAAIALRGPTIPGVLLLAPLLFGGIGTGLTLAPNTNLVLSRVPVREAGGAGGVLSTAQRVGTSIGVAVVGVLLFGSLSTGAPGAAATAAPGLRHALAAGSVPAPARARAVHRFEVCFDRRAGSTDPTGPVPGCPRVDPAASDHRAASAATGHRAAPALAAHAFARAGKDALAHDFTRAMEISMAFNLGAVVLAFLLVFFYPRQPLATSAEASPAASTTS